MPAQPITEPPSDRASVRRLPDRGRYDRATIDAIIDEALTCHVGFAIDGRPWVMPTIHARVGDDVYLHGALANHMLRALSDGVEACVTFTLVDGLVLARSAFHHSMNYRSVVVFATAVAVTDETEKARALDALVEHVAPGRSRDARPPTAAELRKTLVVRLPLHEASAKIRTGGPVDDDEDLALPIWAGVLPCSLTFGAPAPDAGVEVPVPEYVREYARP